MDYSTQIIITSLASLAASSGFWAWFSQRSNAKSATNQLLLGLAHDRIISLGMHYSIKKKQFIKNRFLRLKEEMSLVI